MKKKQTRRKLVKKSKGGPPPPPLKSWEEKVRSLTPEKYTLYVV